MKLFVDYSMDGFAYVEGPPPQMQLGYRYGGVNGDGTPVITDPGSNTRTSSVSLYYSDTIDTLRTRIAADVRSLVADSTASVVFLDSKGVL